MSEKVPFPKWVEKFVFRNNKNVCSLNSHFRIYQNPGIFSLRKPIAYLVFLVFKILPHGKKAPPKQWKLYCKKTMNMNKTLHLQRTCEVYLT